MDYQERRLPVTAAAVLLGPLAIVIDVAVRRLYVREMLGEKVDIAGEKEKRE